MIIAIIILLSIALAIDDAKLFKTIIRSFKTKKTTAHAHTHTHTHEGDKIIHGTATMRSTGPTKQTITYPDGAMFEISEYETTNAGKIGKTYKPLNQKAKENQDIYNKYMRGKK